MTHYLERSRGVLVSLRPSHPHSADSDPGNQPLLHAPRKRNFWSRTLHFKKTWSTQWAPIWDQFQGSWLTQPLLWAEVIFHQIMKSIFCNSEQWEVASQTSVVRAVYISPFINHSLCQMIYIYCQRNSSPSPFIQPTWKLQYSESFTSVIFYHFLSDPSPIIGNACQ